MNEEKPVILVVDDTPDNLMLVSGLLKDLYKVKVATNGEMALAIANAAPPDLILLDVLMPRMNGYETCTRLKENPRLADIPVIFLTALSKVEDEQKGFALGAVDYIIKPISPPTLFARVKTHLMLKQARDFLQDKNAYLEAEVAMRIKEISLIQDVSLFALASLAETRDNETGQHLRRTQQYVKELALDLRYHERFRDFLTPENIRRLVQSVPLHDIGKVGIPDNILLKPDRLTDAEFELMKAHTTIGRDAIVRSEMLLKQPETFLRFAKEIALSHHERWDGSGYPEGLAGEKIPIAARLMAVADVYDALISKRVYKVPMPHEVAHGIIWEESGKHFDPAIVESFLRLERRFLEIAESFRDSHVAG
ncbi:response regulator [Heliophilum fasciatum]|uniref:Stage 0 sporulation protein A homolog n=1 Tax=Heliophilum fasciatum TaxID=35700 RepID=A0A4R2RY73_9FIRM|nr:two-component system response regulator [Heliophilum fasciatum]MCW2276941.1 putative two-component system response regulator [Heliophilum fasciatum]TCP68533.1 putative two-component system response regulator [Heliophilum fasciatum]